jgi:hypothetical protein
MLKILLVWTASLMLVAQYGGVCAQLCLLRRSHHHQHRSPANQVCHRAVLSAAAPSVPVPALFDSAPAARPLHRFVASTTSVTHQEPKLLPFQTPPEPEYPPPRG